MHRPGKQIWGNLWPYVLVVKCVVDPPCNRVGASSILPHVALLCHFLIGMALVQCKDQVQVLVEKKRNTPLIRNPGELLLVNVDYSENSD